MNLLLISLDKTAFEIGDFQGRLIEYGKLASKIFVVVFTLKKEGYKKMRVGENIFIIPTSSKNQTTYVLSGFRVISKIHKKDRIDIISTQDPVLTGLTGYLAKIRFKIPLNIQMHGDFIDNSYWFAESKLNRVFNIMGKFLIKRADSVRVESQIIMDKVRKIKVPSTRISKIPVYANVNKFLYYKPDMSLRNRFSGFKDIILYVGRLSVEKNIPNLLKAAKEVLLSYPMTLFLIVGSGKERERLEGIASELKIEKNVIFTGRVEEVADYYFISDIFVLPSNYEGRPLVIMEAMSCGLPVIVTDVSGARDLIKEGKTGFVVPVNDYLEMSRKINYLLDNRELRIEMGMESKKAVIGSPEIIDFRKNIEQQFDMFKRTVSENPA